jgi:hypothetical protein
MTTWVLTSHAIDRFHLRHAPELTRDQARERLLCGLTSATPLRERTFRGDQQFQLDAPKCVAVVKRDDGAADSIVVVTVLPQKQAHEVDEDTLADFRRYVDTLHGNISQVHTSEAQLMAARSNEKLAKVEKLEASNERMWLDILSRYLSLRLKCEENKALWLKVQGKKR